MTTGKNLAGGAAALLILAATPAHAASAPLQPLLGTLPLVGPSLVSVVNTLPVLGPAINSATSGNNTALAGLPLLGTVQTLGPTLVTLADTGFTATAPLSGILFSALTTGGATFAAASGLTPVLSPALNNLFNATHALPGLPLIGPLFGGAPNP